MKDTLFISHANPQDNDFTVWLASRLQLMGYVVWCDIEGLMGGEKHWEVIDNEIRNNAIKFLLVVSKDICSEPGKLKDGISKEFSLGESVAKKASDDNFIIPLKIDEDAPYDYFIGLNRYSHIKFNENWAVGLKSLIKKLEKDGVKTIDSKDNKLLNSWYKNRFTTKYGLYKKIEKYFTNFWLIDEIWDVIEIYQYDNDRLAEEVYFQNRIYPVVRHGNYVVTFGEATTEIEQKTTFGNYRIKPNNKFIIATSDILTKKYQSDTFPTLTDCQNLLKRLLNRSFHLLMKSKRASWYELSAKRSCYYYSVGVKDKVSFVINDNKKTKNLIGHYKISPLESGYWHFGITAKALIDPILCFSLKSHILFSNDGEHIWQEKDKLHRARRKKGRRWFNEEWKDQLLAFINSLKDESGKITLLLNKDCPIDMAITPMEITSDFGYSEPSDKTRQDILGVESLEENTIVDD